MHLVIYETGGWTDFAPLSLGRPACLLVCGAGTLLEKQLRHFQPTRLTLWVRPAMADFVRQRVESLTELPFAINQPLDDQPATLLDGRCLLLADPPKPSGECAALDSAGAIVQAHVVARGLSHEDALGNSAAWRALAGRPRCAGPEGVAGHLWDLIEWNDRALRHDAHYFGAREEALPAGVHGVAMDEIRLGEHAMLQPGVVLDASGGPVLIGARATIGANSVIQGPCWIGPDSQVAPRTLVRAGVSIGPNCRAAGEMIASILLCCTNKAHEGFLGHSYLGEWVNLGAGTTTSNLKNTYGPISTSIGNRKISTGRQFLGSLIGDYARTAICTRLMAGTYIGYSSMVAMSAIVPKRIGSYQFCTDGGTEVYQFDKAMAVMKTVMTRRHRQWTAANESIARAAAEWAAAEGL